MSSRWKKVWADFWSNKTRTILTILTITVGTFAVGFNSNMAKYMAESMESDFLSASPSEAMLYGGPMNDDTVKMARTVPGVSAVEGSSTFSGQLIGAAGKKIAIQFTAVKNPYDLTVNTLKPVKGASSIPPLDNKEVLLDSSAESLGYKPGDMLLIELDNGKHRELRLGGYLHCSHRNTLQS